MNRKRITIISGHYGSGKTNIALSLAASLRKAHDRVLIADIDIVNPYFRTKDSEALLRSLDIRLICSTYANTNLDIPALPPDLYTVTDDKSYQTVLDVGGDERGALALGRLAPAIREENNYEMLFVINCYRPLTQDPDSAITVMKEIEEAAGLCCTGIVNNSNLGDETTKETLLSSLAYAEEVAKKSGLPLLFHTVDRRLYSECQPFIPNLFPLDLQSKFYKENTLWQN